MSSKPKQKVCKSCNSLKKISEYHKDGIKYIRTDCKVCFQKKKVDRRNKLKKWLTDYKELLSCSVCNYSKETHKTFSIRAIEFHHHNKDKLFNVSEGPTQGFSKESILKEIQKCLVLCARCHAELHHRLKQST
tara:strand:+ start:9611 stop:10009 length:399 start_codon:yes stop_codon:yes gene_type:complete